MSTTLERSPGEALPPEGCRPASSYLLPEGRLTRCVQTVEAFAGERGRQRLEIELRAPEGEDGGTWYLPLFFFSKVPVAPDLEVRDGAGAVVPMPTKLQNQALTEHAVEELLGEFDVSLEPELRALVHDVIFAEALTARISRLVLERRAELPDRLVRLLEALEDQFVLWMPVRGEAPHRFVVTRSLLREQKFWLRRRRRDQQLDVQTAAGRVRIRIKLPTGRMTLPAREIFERLLLAFGTHIVTFHLESVEAPRFASFHLRATAPSGFVVRQVFADGSGLDRPVGSSDMHLQRFSPTPRMLSVQGNGSEVGHIHVVQGVSPARLRMRVALALRPDLIGFWALVVVLTAVLLWLFQRAGVAWIYESEGALESVVTILLLIPSAASALALRAEEGGLVRQTMWVTRMTLFASALLSIATALVLLFPASERTRIDLVGDFAALAYVLAAIILVSWTLGQTWVWAIYERLLDNRRANLLAVALLAALVIVVIRFSAFPGALTAALLMAIGLGFAAVATNRMLDLQGLSSGLFMYLAVAGAIACIAGASFFIDYFAYLSTDDVRVALRAVAAGIAVVALIGVGRSIVTGPEPVPHGSGLSR
jgi:hypothetical protein